jgi:predicted nucleotidyltransferase component of viral defense system
MPIDERYRAQVALLVRTLPSIATEKDFALKGGTAINLFVRNLPRLSVDIDLTYLPVKPRGESLADITAAMTRIAADVERNLRQVRVTLAPPDAEGCVRKISIQQPGAQIKVEVTPVTRGCVYAPELKSASPRVEEAFGFAETQVVSFADLYAGKIVAALDRQHPRDLFDVRDLLANEGITPELRNAVVVYLVSHDRPIDEVVAPRRKDISADFMRDFNGMTETPVDLDMLIEARERLIADVIGQMPEEHRKFLMSIHTGTPAWELIDVPGIDKLPAVQWRQQNIAKLTPEKRALLIERLGKALNIDAT